LGSWNHYATDGPRTNNSLEGWHGRLKIVIGKAHPNVYEFIQVIRDEQKMNEIRLVQYSAGQRLPPKKKKYQDLQRQLDVLKNRLERGDLDVVEFLDHVSHSIKLS